MITENFTKQSKQILDNSLSSMQLINKECEEEISKVKKEQAKKIQSATSLEEKCKMLEEFAKELDAICDKYNKKIDNIRRQSVKKFTDLSNKCN